MEVKMKMTATMKPTVKARLTVVKMKRTVRMKMAVMMKITLVAMRMRTEVQ